MALRLYYHPLSSFCQKVLIALYERDVPFEAELVDLGNPDHRAALQALWPLAKFPVLRDEATGVAQPEATIIVEWLDSLHPGPPPLIPGDSGAALEARLWDRILDNYVHLPMQRIVGDSLRPQDAKDPYGVEEAKALLAAAYAMIEDRLAERGGEAWIAGDRFSLADCAAAPALFYANIVAPFAGHRHVEAYFERLLERPSFARAVEEARPYRHMFPLEWPPAYS